MEPQGIIRLLWNYGHFHSPEALTVWEVQESDLDKLTMTDTVVQAALRSYQSFFSDALDQFTLRAPQHGGHLRESIADGIIGPATMNLLAMPRCGVPDYRPPNQAALEGNWPDTCRLQLTSSYQMNLSGLSQEQIKELWIEADRNWEKAIEIKITLELQNYPNTSIFANAESMGGSVLAYQELARNSCSHRLHGAYNSRVSWTPSLAVATMTHEHGHAWGCDHVGDSQATMYPSITPASMNRRGALNPTDISEALSKGYKKRTTPIPDPDDPPPDGKYRFYVESDAPIRIVTHDVP